MPPKGTAPFSPSHYITSSWFQRRGSQSRALGLRAKHAQGLACAKCRVAAACSLHASTIELSVCLQWGTTVEVSCEVTEVGVI